MADKDPAGKIPRLRLQGERLKSGFSRWFSGRKLASRKYDKAVKAALLLGLSLALTTTLAPRHQEPLQKYKQGDIAREDLKAFRDFLVEDQETTAKRQRELLAQVPPVYDLDEEAVVRISERLQRAFAFMRQEQQRLAAAQAPAPGLKKKGRGAAADATRSLDKLKPEFDRLLGTTIPNPSFQLLARTDFSPSLEALVLQVLGQVCRQGVISGRSLIKPEAQEILVRRLPSRQEQVLSPPYPFLAVDDLRKPVAGYCRDIAADFSPADRWLVCDLVQHLVTPNLTPNLAETRERQQARLRELKPAFFQVKRGEFLVREGERLAPVHVAKLKAQSLVYPQGRGAIIFVGIFVSLALLLLLIYNLARLAINHFSDRLGDLAFLAVLLLGSAALNRGLLGLGEMLAQSRPAVGTLLVYLWPVALAPIFAALFLGLETGLGLAFLTATFSALLLDKPFPLFLYFLSAGLVGVWGVRNCRQRSDLIRTGLYLCLVNILMATAIELLDFPFAAQDLLLSQVFAVGSGLATGIVALGMTPVIEAAFRYSSNIRLLEILNLDQPLLKDLMLHAPGTYHHSIIVGQMVEGAAEAIGANPLLAKAAAYYHDIGKAKKPAYFVENQLGGENRHEKLAPSMSSLILIAHVKDGVEMARKSRLGDRIADIIQQHHGTSLISYFYHKAKSTAANPGIVNVADYRYPGPRPQTKEAGLVLIADQVEAASKTLTEPTPARIQGMVQKIVNNIFADGQLDECELTLKELHLIARHCNKVLSGFFHQRIIYPQPAEKTRAHEHPDKQPAKKNNGKPGEPQEKGREDLKRLGMD